MKNFTNEIYKFANLLLGEECFAFSRFSDGELRMMQSVPIIIEKNRALNNGVEVNGYWGEEELKNFDPETDKEYQTILTECFKFRKHNYFKGICCKCCVGHQDWDWQFEHVLEEEPDDPHLTWANLCINNNYRSYLKEIVPRFSEYPVVVVANRSSKLEGLPFYNNIVKWFPIGNNCYKEDYHLIEEMKEWVATNKVTKHLFLFAAASLSNYLIYELYKNYEDNTYFDIGSSLNPMMGLDGWRGSRGYLLDYWENKPDAYARRICEW